MDISFKEVNINGLNFLLGLIYKFYSVNEKNSLAADLRKSTEELLLNPEYGKAWFILVDKKTAGYIVLTFGFSIEYRGRDALVDELFIDELYRGKGIGKKALQFIAEYSMNNGIKAIHLEVKEKHKRAKNLYEREGFVKHNSEFMTKKLF